MNKFLIIVVFITQITLGQQKCDMKEVETFVQEQMIGFQKSEKDNGEKFDFAVSEYSKVKKFTQKQESEYYLKILEKNKLVESMSLKNDMIMQLMDVLKQATESPSEENCNVKGKVEEFYVKALKITENEWKLVFNNLEQDYKAATGKDLVYKK